MLVKLYTIKVKKDGKVYRDIYVQHENRSIRIKAKYPHRYGTDNVPSIESILLNEWASDEVYEDNKEQK